MLTSSISRRAIAPALAVALVAGAAPVATAAPGAMAGMDHSAHTMPMPASK